MKLSRRARRATLVTHIAFSAGWLGLSLALLALAVTAATTRQPDTVASSYRSISVFTDWLILPLSLTTLATGLVLSLGTPWGLLRHRWVLAKFCLTLAATTASAFAFRPEVSAAAARVTSGQPVESTIDLVLPPAVSLTTYVFITAVSVLKPWGLTRRGRNIRASARKAVDAKGVRQTA
ncbi:DUF2269 domain-containing protein [Streptomyces sp. NPDC005955]|uniref:DUF2269 domain-containing protein n=1 Tax=Streptomyces sp. NPDC005955 TaxID=3364738 RepID=UPI0036C5CC51